MASVALVQFLVTGAGAVDAEAQEGAKGHGAIEAPVEAEHELVEVRLEMGFGDAVEGAVEPGLEVGCDGADQRQPCIHAGAVAEHGKRLVMVAAARKAFELAAIVGGNVGSGGDTVLGEAVDLGGGLVGQHPHAEPPRHGAFDDLARLRVPKFLLPNFYGEDHRRFVCLPAPPSLVLATDEGNVHLDRPLCPDGVLIGTHHGSSELVQHHKCRLVPRDSQLLLQLQRRDSGRLRRDQVGRPKPDLKRRPGALHDRAGGQPSLVQAGATFEHACPRRQPERFFTRSTALTAEPRRPSHTLQVSTAGRLVREHAVELQQVCWKVGQRSHGCGRRLLLSPIRIGHLGHSPSETYRSGALVRQPDRQDIAAPHIAQSRAEISS